ncbi:MAG TPA: bifunctional 5,10-methylene-tetrahydrofolate dehydrogenase/5,10-methylene-tetrahydrofolate cyclohydrolase [Algoriphagus sp.]|jgi:methylenetetrahydrofolate dehydrogenase (NADP+)/methenyltetrahydrofolate cyclohydrolase|uniref:bifunctional 5,10-methylenetetrahydrofolate dehydrogenase/5,10-methenyltetrahydrofolate cyclohydrolase n=1 Tax=unclassified Algoriphagus TaxID=2641541 RepID=UPI000C6A2846|nr:MULTISPECIES: tetrahydrofolate dehydrogenase/cyclohydrolase catalytic domain-containing protein [unclassified Algoriphagus]MAL15163.1 bifunctional 5,10-methylene-tetrahydrofolate dehydrogenase/5,10-methylene-tetrahydrofolate cyclohydrolase [Algoriphagus sp.]MAN85476.1 bifunctional 5,10-methylene-tetrahydrofolate dehydrogenase/5,10-methylene-tetrahydrofolate cyclohydrolase [Algoriphagus sp.]QYH37791.1 bifunctional 5,10-methylene-tetrahydrofolate dehydrogenase/5,10-methylene-tetrahydrofolate cy|tara:strand:+ start:2699 stop:3583 length:885 start_codon:yes stop_codon:yes gene_type:complete
MATIIDGKKTSQDIKNEIAARVAEIKTEGGKIPHLAAILVGSDGASQTYVGAKVKACHEIGFESTLVRLDDTISEEELLAKVEEINANPDIDGLIVQLPLPKHISVEKVTDKIKPEKDVDGFTPSNVGRMALNWPAYVAATPYGIVELLKRYNIETSGKHCVVIGRSHIVGSPMSILMARNGYPGNATVTLTHSRTQNLKEIAQTADILIVALGKPEFVTADMVKPGAVVIDVGIHRVEDASKKSGFRLIGDVKFDEVAEKASAITPVPGGVGPMTIASLLYNTLLAAEKKVYR